MTESLRMSYNWSDGKNPNIKVVRGVNVEMRRLVILANTKL